MVLKLWGTRDSLGKPCRNDGIGNGRKLGLVCNCPPENKNPEDSSCNLIVFNYISIKLRIFATDGGNSVHTY